MNKWIGWICVSKKCLILHASIIDYHLWLSSQVISFQHGVQSSQWPGSTVELLGKIPELCQVLDWPGKLRFWRLNAGYGWEWGNGIIIHMSFILRIIPSFPIWSTSKHISQQGATSRTGELPTPLSNFSWRWPLQHFQRRIYTSFSQSQPDRKQARAG